MTDRPREAYVRVEVRRGGREFIPGVELRDDDDIDAMYAAVMYETIMGIVPELDDRANARSIESRIRGRWPDRAMFLEVGRTDRYVQIWHPWCTCQR